MEDRHLTIQEIADEVGINRGSTNMILTGIWACKEWQKKLVSKLLLPSSNIFALKCRAGHAGVCQQRF
jgi:hypothetical protein